MRNDSVTPDRESDIVRRILNRGMLLHSINGKSYARCRCGYLAEIDWYDDSFPELHGCTFTAEQKGANDRH